VARPMPLEAPVTTTAASLILMRRGYPICPPFTPRRSRVRAAMTRNEAPTAARALAGAETVDAVIVGAGHNGLVVANLLADA
jgi:hypothetical protein